MFEDLSSWACIVCILSIFVKSMLIDFFKFFGKRFDSHEKYNNLACFHKTAVLSRESIQYSIERE